VTKEIMPEFTYKRIDDKTVQVTITGDHLETTEQPGSSEQPVLVILDRSYSMGGSRIRHALDALRTLVRRGSIHLISYDDRVEDHGIIPMDGEVPRISSRGSTYFTQVWDYVTRLDYEGPIIFMTDGEDNGSPKFHDVQHERMKFLPGVQIFAVAIEAQADTSALLELTRICAIPGEFALFSSTGESSETYTSEANWLADRVFSVQKIEFRGKEYILPSGGFLDLYIEDTEMDVPAGDMRDRIAYLTHRTDLAVKMGMQCSMREIQELRSEVERIFLAAKNYPNRSELRRSLEPVNALIRQFLELRHNNMTISNADLAKIAIASRDLRTGSKFQRRVAERQETSLKKIEEDDHTLADLAKDFDPKTIPDEVNKQFVGFAGDDPRTVCEEGGALGLVFHTQSGEPVTVDPTHPSFEITQVGVSLVSAEEFFAAANFRADKDGQVSFDSPVMPDGGRIQVNSILPLFIHPEHWKFARLWATRCASHAMTRDPTIGTVSHTFYAYLALWNALRSAESQFHRDLAADVLQVLKHLPMPLPTPEKFTSEVASRVPDSVPRLNLMTLAYEALFPSAHEDFPLMSLYIREEAFRREKHDVQTVLQKYIGMPPKLHDIVRDYLLVHAPKKQTSVSLDVLIARARDVGRQDALAALHRAGNTDPVQSNGVVLTAESVEACIQDFYAHLGDLQIILSKVQAARGHNSTDHVNGYRDYFVLDEATLENIWKDVCVKYASEACRKELNQANYANQSDTISRLGNATDLEWLALVMAKCEIKSNISQFANEAQTPAHVAMLTRSTFDAGKLLGLDHPWHVPAIDWTPAKVSRGRKRNSSIRRLHPEVRRAKTVWTERGIWPY